MHDAALGLEALLKAITVAVKVVKGNVRTVERQRLFSRRVHKGVPQLHKRAQLRAVTIWSLQVDRAKRPSCHVNEAIFGWFESRIRRLVADHQIHDGTITPRAHTTIAQDRWRRICGGLLTTQTAEVAGDHGDIFKIELEDLHFARHAWSARRSRGGRCRTAAAR